jgi:hypothetical protein
MIDPAIVGRIPLVCRPKPPGRHLAERLTDLAGLAADRSGGSHHQQVARASAVLNFAALIASDAGLADLAEELCWRQYTIFAEARHPDQNIAVMTLMPVVNIARLLIREGDGNSAYDILQQLYEAARQRGAATIRGREVDLSPWTQTTAGHRTLCTELWVTILTDGARALARSGRWTEAAQTMAAHHGIGNRLLDGRQIKILSLMEQSLRQQAAELIESSIPAEPWEHTIAAILRTCCRPTLSPAWRADLQLTVRGALSLAAQPEPMTASFRARVGLTALDLSADQPTQLDLPLRTAIITLARSDAYAARDILGHQPMHFHMTRQQHDELTAIITASGLGAGQLSAAHLRSITAAVRQAEGRLHKLLRCNHGAAEAGD